MGNDPEEKDILNAVFSDQTFAFMVLETNRYAEEQIARLRNGGHLKENSRAANLRETSITEIKAFIGPILLMGHTRQPRFCSYWSTSFLPKQPAVRQIMSRDRVLSIFQFFHLCNNNDALPVDHPNHDYSE